MNNTELISNLLSNYYDNFSTLIEQAELEDSVHLSIFQKTQALKINVPKSPEWEIQKSLNDFLNKITAKNILIIYSDSKSYLELHKNLSSINKNISYISWYEIFSTMSLNNLDKHRINNVNQKLKQSQLTIFADPPYDVSEVIDHVCAFTLCCLIFVNV